jgi:hypothetical protein
MKKVSYDRMIPILFQVLLSACIVQSNAGFTAAQDRPPAGQVNSEHSRVYIFVDKSGVVGHQHAIEGKLSQGEMFLSTGRPGSLVFDMQSFDADTPNARKYIGLDGTTEDSMRKKVNDNMLGHEVLSVKKYPTATLDKAILKSKPASIAGQSPEYMIQGEFTLHEKTRTIEIPCKVEVENGWHHVKGKFKILQSDYGIRPYSKMLGAVGVTDELTIYGDLWVVPEQ